MPSRNEHFPERTPAIASSYASICVSLTDLRSTVHAIRDLRHNAQPAAIADLYRLLGAIDSFAIEALASKHRAVVVSSVCHRLALEVSGMRHVLELDPASRIDRHMVALRSILDGLTGDVHELQRLLGSPSTDSFYRPPTPEVFVVRKTRNES